MENKTAGDVLNELMATLMMMDPLDLEVATELIKFLKEHPIGTTSTVNADEVRLAGLSTLVDEDKAMVGIVAAPLWSRLEVLLKEPSKNKNKILAIKNRLTQLGAMD